MSNLSLGGCRGCTSRKSDRKPRAEQGLPGEPSQALIPCAGMSPIFAPAQKFNLVAVAGADSVRRDVTRSEASAKFAGGSLCAGERHAVA